jgi:hypothetical protein
MTRAVAALLSTCLVLSANGCITARPRAESYRERLQEGMTKAEVTGALGRPKETFPVPGQPKDPRVVVENWRYSYKVTGWVYPLVIITLGLAVALVRWDPWRFDVGFGADGRVLRITEPVKDR